ncbi:MAG: DUF2752 domain-containing protein [Myxococcota bacterium]|nr:DUF2752 domain-containing protein [Myxococcota bacterium]
MTLTWPAPNRTFGLLDALGLTGVVGLLVARFIPIAKLPFWGCVFREHFGWPCLGCGLTRVADRMSHLNVLGAWSANPLGTVVAGLFMVAAVWSALHLAFKVPVPELKVSDREFFWFRMTAVLLVAVNYAWVIIQYRYPQWLAGS